MKYDEFTHCNQYVYVDWDVSSRCNYSCLYCPVESHDGKVNFPKLEIVKSVVDKIASEYSDVKEFAVYNILGGEPTIWNELPEFSKYIKTVNNKNVLQLLTNGNRTLRWWTKTVPYIDKVIVSVHVAQSDINELVDKFNALANDMYIDFQIAMDVAVFDKAVADYHYAYNNLHKNISITHKPLRKVLSGTELMLYSDEQINIMNKLSSRWGKNFDVLDSPMIKKMNGVVVNNSVKINQLVLSKQNSWRNWACWIGIDSITITREGNIKLGSGCNPNLILGNINNLNFKFPLIPVKCNYDICGCFADICTTKKLNYIGDTL